MEKKRIAAVTGGLALAGALVGGVLGACGGVAVVLWHGGPGALARQAGDVLFAGMVSGLFGAVLGPLAAWMLMRHVPIWLAIGGTALGTLAGIGVSIVTDTAIFLYPFLGFFLAALVLRLGVGRRQRVRVSD